MLEEDLIPQYPMCVSVEAGKTYVWCGCGKTGTKPLCDKSGDCSLAIEYQSILNEDVYFCSCLQSARKPFCDGSHAALLREYHKLTGR